MPQSLTAEMSVIWRVCVSLSFSIAQRKWLESTFTVSCHSSAFQYNIYLRLSPEAHPGSDALIWQMSVQHLSCFGHSAQPASRGLIFTSVIQCLSCMSRSALPTRGAANWTSVIPSRAGLLLFWLWPGFLPGQMLSRTKRVLARENLWMVCSGLTKVLFRLFRLNEVY